MLAAASDAPSNASPAPRNQPQLQHCRECGHPFYAARKDQEFCRPKCRQDWHKRRYERGAALYDFAMEWRGKRLKGGFTRLCQMIDEWLRDERERKACNKAMHKGGKNG